MRIFLSIMTTVACCLECTSHPQKSPVEASNAQVSPFTMPFVRANWIEDLNQLEKFISEAYPNLDAAEANRLDLHRLDQETRLKLNQSDSNLESFNTLKDFVAKFKDGHFHLETESENPVPDFNGDGKISALPRSTSGAEACQKVVMPNCARYSRKGVNEVLGIEPDVTLPMENLNSENFSAYLVRYLKDL